MNEADYTEEYKRRLERYRREERGVYAAYRAEDQPDPTRSKMLWDEETQSYVRVSTEVDSHAIDRGEG